MNENMHIDARGEHFIATFEGCVLHPYNDPLNATIGVGHLIHMGVVTEADVRRYRGFTYAAAMKLLAQDVGSAQAAIRRRINVELNQNQWDALVSAVFNCGPGILTGSAGTLINARQFPQAAQALLAWDHVNGVVVAGLARRREAEKALFLAAAPAEPPYWGPHELNWMHEYDRLLSEKHSPARRLFLRAQMARRARQIVVSAHRDGWNKLNRRQRYHSMKARS
jgi:GH24 family phage-related lysozyme (muramidase)